LGISTAFGQATKAWERSSESWARSKRPDRFQAVSSIRSNSSAVSLVLGKGQDETMAMIKAGSIDSTTGINALVKGWDQMFGGTAQSEWPGFSGSVLKLR
jgi:hypothetical protein